MEPRFSRHVRDAYGDRADLLADAAEAVRATLESPGYKLIAQLVTAEVASEDQRLQYNPDQVPDQAVYAARHGYRTGLLATQQAASTLIEYADHKLREQQDRHEHAPASRG